MEGNRKPCYAKSIAPKSFVSRVIKTVLINMTSCFTKKVTIATIMTTAHKHLFKGIYSTLTKLQFSLLYGLITRQYYHK